MADRGDLGAGDHPRSRRRCPTARDRRAPRATPPRPGTTEDDGRVPGATERAPARRRGRAPPRAGRPALRRHRGLHPLGGRARGPRVARAARPLPGGGPRGARPVRGARGRRRRGWAARGLRRSDARRPVRGRDRPGRAGARPRGQGRRPRRGVRGGWGPPPGRLAPPGRPPRRPGGTRRGARVRHGSRRRGRFRPPVPRPRGPRAPGPPRTAPRLLGPRRGHVSAGPAAAGSPPPRRPTAAWVGRTTPGAIPPP